ncbi:MAG: 2-phosphosulfolactate phosphatase [Clostridiales bacterium]|nr:2-phosphosulfolactate phosphatase [Clostridiales bacterium]
MAKVPYTGPVRTLSLIEGAKQARGLCVIIDVFRAFSLECCLYDLGAGQVRPVGSVEETLRLHERIPGSVLIGERGGARIEGFDYGNSPSVMTREAICGRTILHTTSAGTQGVVNAVHAEEIITGSLVNAAAVAAYIAGRQPREVSLVCMGTAGIAPAAEDELCAAYIESLLRGEPMEDIAQRAAALQYGGGAHFFDPAMQHIYPEADFHFCIRRDVFPFVLRVEKDELGFVSRQVCCL